MNNNVTLSDYIDPCQDCSTLCCRVYDIIGTWKFKGIIIKVLWENCSHIENTKCNIHSQRNELWFWACEEFSCFGTWALVTEWLKNSWADFSLSRVALNKAREYIQNLLDFDTREEFESSRLIDHSDWLEHIRYILTLSPIDSEESVRKHWDDYIYPKRWYTQKENEIMEIRRNKALAEIWTNVL